MKNKTVWLLIGLWMCVASDTFSEASPQKQSKLSAIDQRLQNSVKQTQYLHLYGDGPLWRHATKISGINASQGIEVRDKRLIQAFLQNFRCTDQTAEWDVLSERNGYIHVDLMGQHHPFLDSIDYIIQGKRAYELKSRADGIIVFMKPGYGPRFEAYVQDLAKRLHAHDQGVVVWDINAS